MYTYNKRVKLYFYVILLKGKYFANIKQTELSIEMIKSYCVFTTHNLKNKTCHHKYVL